MLPYYDVTGDNFYVITTKMEEENAPLLTNEGEIPTDVPNPRDKIRSLYASDRVLGRHSPYNANDGGTINISSSTSVQNFAEVDQIVSIFVVAFDTKAGECIYNIVLLHAGMSYDFD